MTTPVNNSMPADRSPLFAGLRSLAARLWSIVRRIYALGLIALILWLSVRAIRYLVVSLITPAATPAQIAALPKSLDMSTLLEGHRTDWTGLSAVENPRAPLSHYHRFENWLQADAANDCTRSGCHGPLPHAKRKEDRAFLNMHATTLHCGVCHMSGDDAQLALGWYDVNTGKKRPRPALLEAYERFESLALKAEARPTDSRPRSQGRSSPEEQRSLVTALNAADSEAGGEPGIRKLAEHLNAVRAGSAAFDRLVLAGRDVLPRYFRGSYGAKLALLAGGDGLLLGHPGTETAIKAFLAEKDSVKGSRRDELLKNVHPRRRAEPLHCRDCHVENGSRVNFAGLGYPPARIRALFQPDVFRMIEHIQQGQEFRIPTVTVPAGEQK